jgi:hypothetical protein
MSGTTFKKSFFNIKKNKDKVTKVKSKNFCPDEENVIWGLFCNKCDHTAEKKYMGFLSTFIALVFLSNLIQKHVW